MIAIISKKNAPVQPAFAHFSPKHCNNALAIM